MTNKNDKDSEASASKMPEIIWAYEEGATQTGTWIDFDDSCDDDIAVKYIRADLVQPPKAVKDE